MSDKGSVRDPLLSGDEDPRKTPLEGGPDDPRAGGGWQRILKPIEDPEDDS